MHTDVVSGKCRDNNFNRFPRVTRSFSLSFSSLSSSLRLHVRTAFLPRTDNHYEFYEQQYEWLVQRLWNSIPIEQVLDSIFSPTTIRINSEQTKCQSS